MQIRFVFLTVVLMSAFLGVGEGLPEGYQALEYVESEGPRASTTAKVGQFIDTGVVPNGRVPTVRIKYRLSDSSLSGEGYVFGYWNLANNVGTAIGILNGSGRYRVCDKAIYYGSPDKNVHEFELNTTEGTIMDGSFAGDDGSKLRSVIDRE